MFPIELTAYPQWVCWRLESVIENGKTKLTKIPYCPQNGSKASTSDPSTWSDYQTAVKVASNGGFYSGIGFVFTENDPYAGIDLDNPEGNPDMIAKQTAIAEAMNSYSEISPSGSGLHIIIKAKLHNGRRRGKIEIYSSGRYFTMTGNTYQDKPIADCNHLANRLWEELGDNGGGNNIDVKTLSQPERYTDDVIYNVAIQAENSAKFIDLYNGNWPRHYTSQSEADFALVNMLGFYSRNVAQIRRMFQTSELGKRDKAKRKAYLDNMIQRSFDNLPPMVALDELIIKSAQELAAKRATAIVEIDRAKNINPWHGDLFQSVPDPNYDWTRPPGLLGEISQFVYEAAPRPVKEIALGAAIGLMAGIAGRAYNISGTGLNQYVLILARTGIGKEAAASGIDKLGQAIRQYVPAITEFLGPAEIASGQALLKYICKHPCFVSVVGEFGLALQAMNSGSANPAQLALRRALLDLYVKSGKGRELKPTIYADQDKNTEIVQSPSFSLLGESTPETYYQSVDESMITQGLLPRFMGIEYTGERPPRNVAASLAEPNQKLVEKIADLAANCLTLAQHNKVIDVQLGPEAKLWEDKYCSDCDRHINTSDQAITRELWNRAHLKVLKLSSLIAIGINQYEPVITVEALEWSRILVERDILAILGKFATGKAGKVEGELNQLNELVDAISQYVKRSWESLKGYKIPESMHKDGIIPMQYLQRRLLSNSAFKNDRVGPSIAINRSLNSLLSDGSIRNANPADMLMRYNSSMKAYVVTDLSRF